MKKALIFAAIALFCGSGALGYLAHRAWSRPSFVATDGRGGMRFVSGRAMMESLEKDRNHPEIAEFYALANADADKAKWSATAYAISAIAFAAGGGVSWIAGRKS